MRNSLCGALGFLALTSASLAQVPVSLPVPVVRQATIEWCWVAAAEMILKYKGAKSPRQCEIMERGYGGLPGSCCGDTSRCTQPGQITDIQRIVAFYGGVLTNLNRPALPAELYSILSQGSPVVAHLNLPTGGHFVVIRGMTWEPSPVGLIPIVQINDPMSSDPLVMPFDRLVGVWDAAVYVDPATPFSVNLQRGANEIQACMADKVTRCMRACTSRGYSEANCQSLICRPGVAANVEWDNDCK